MSDEVEDFAQDCEECGNIIEEDEYNATGVTDSCYECAPCSDPRGHSFGTCGCGEEDEE